MSLRRCAPLLALILLAGCQADDVTIIPEDPEDPVVTLDAADGWSGGTLIARSSNFRLADTLPLVTAGAETLAVTMNGKGAIAIHLPDSNTTLDLHVRFQDGRSLDLGPVKVHGFASWGLGVPMTGDPVQWPGTNVPTAIAYAGRRLVQVDYRFNTVTPLTDDTVGGCGAGPIPSATDPTIITFTPVTPSPSGQVADSCHRTVSRQIASPGGAPPDTSRYTASARQIVARLSSGRWLWCGKQSCTVDRPMPGGDLEVDVRGYGIVASPAGDRTVLRAYGGPVPVLDPRVPQVAFTLSGYAVLGAAFAATGDTLYVLRSGRLSGMSFFDDSVMVLDARSGAQLRAVSASGADTSLLWPLYLEFSDLILDPNGRWIYALGASSDAGRSVVLVYERASLALVGELRLPPDVNPTVEGPVAMTHCTSNEVDYCSRRLLMSASERRLYLATYNRWSYEDAPQVVFRYDLIP